MDGNIENLSDSSEKNKIYYRQIEKTKITNGEDRWTRGEFELNELRVRLYNKQIVPSTIA